MNTAIIIQTLQEVYGNLKDTNHHVINITNYNVLIDGRNFYDQPINDLVKQYDKVRKIATGQGDEYTTGCLLDYQYFKDHYNLIAIDLSEQIELDADSRVIQQILWDL